MPGEVIISQSPEDDFDEHQLSCIQELRYLIKNNPRLVLRAHNRFLARFLYHCNWDVQKSYEFCCKAFKFRANNPKFFLFGPLSMLNHLIQANCKFLLPNRDKDGRRIFIVRMSQFLVAKTFLELSQMDDLWMETIMDEPETQKNGVSTIIDVKNTPLGLIKWLQPKLAKVAAEKSEMAPLTIHYHVINSNALLNAGVTLMFKFLSPETQKRVYIHNNDLESLHKHIGAENLPPIYGGTAKDMDMKKLSNALYNRENDLLDYMIQGYIESEPNDWDHELFE